MKNAPHSSIPRLLPLLILVGLASPASTIRAGVGPRTSSVASVSGITALAINPANPSTLYAGTAGSGVFKSTDSGGTWAAINSGLTNPNVVTLAIDPKTPSTLYAATQYGEVFKSTDSGGTWADTGLSDVSALAVDPVTPSTLYAGGTNGEGVFKSTDAGRTWTAANVGLGDLTGVEVPTLAINPLTPTTIYAGLSAFDFTNGVFRSTDAGRTWTSEGLINVWTLAVDPVTPSTLYVGTDDEVYKSTDSGETWVGTLRGVNSEGPSGVVALAIDPVIPSTLYAGTYDGVVFRTADAGRSWIGTGVTNENAFTALLPTSAHSAGRGGAFYTTDLLVSNVSGTAAIFTLKFLGNNRDGSSGSEKTFNIDPGKTTTFSDVLGSIFGETDNFGAIRVTSNTSALDIVSVTSTPGFGGTFGLTVPAVPFSGLIPRNSAGSIPYIREGDGFRSNLVLANEAGVPVEVGAELLSPSGVTLATKTYFVPPNGMTQINRVVRDMGVSTAVTGARLVLSPSWGNALFSGIPGIAGFASVIDETTNDATPVLAGPEFGAVGFSEGTFTWLLASTAHSSGANGAFYTTNVSVSNTSYSPVSFTMKFLGHDRDGSSGPERTFKLEGRESVVFGDVLASVFGETSNFGALRISASIPANASALQIVSVTSTPGFGGTFGQTIPAVLSSDLVPSSSSRSILSIREEDGFRTNLVLASNAGVPTNVDVSLVSPEGVSLATKTYSVPPNGMTQINRVVRDMGVFEAVTGARLVLSSSTPGAAFTGFVSVIDEVTNDPTAVSAK